MTLHDRIMKMNTSHLSGDESFWQGVDAARFRAIMIAKEADELMAEMAEFIRACNLVDDLDIFLADKLEQKYRAWKERTQ